METPVQSIDRDSGIQIKNSALIPPWLWLWLVTYFLTLPQYFTSIKQAWASIGYAGSSTGALGPGQSVLGLHAFLEIIPMIALLLGVVGLAFPTARANYLEKKYKLKPTSALTGAIADIVDFLRQYDANLQVKVNLVRPGQYAFVYPLSFRQTGVAIFAPLVKLWRADRPMAESILRHELAHYRQGDAFVVGAGSPFRAVMNRSGWLYLGLFIIPTAVSIIAGLVTFLGELNELSQLGISWLSMLPSLIPHLISTLAIRLVGAIAITISLLFWMLSIFMLPLVGIWCAEFNADLSAAQQSRSDTLRAVSQPSTSVPSRRQWLLSRLSHPPDRLRRWFLAHQQPQVAMVILLLCYPLAYLLRLLTLSVFSISLGQFNLAENWAIGLRTVAPVWLVIAIVLALWPLCSSRWEQLISQSPVTAKLKPMPYWISTGVVIFLAIIGYGQSA